MKSFRKRTVNKTKKKLNRKEAQNIIEKEFSDNKGNKIKFRFDFNPHPINEPTIQGGFNYGDEE